MSEKVTRLYAPHDPEGLLAAALEACRRKGNVIAAHIVMLDDKDGLWQDGCGVARATLLWALEMEKKRMLDEAEEEEK